MMTKMKFYIILICLFITNFVAANDKILVKGFIYDNEKNPVPDAAIAIEGYGGYVFSNNNGGYRFEIQNPGEYLIVISHVNFSTFNERLMVNDGKKEIIKDFYFINEAFYQINGISVTATKGIRKSESVPLPVSFINSESINNEYYRNSGDMLDQIPGINVRRNGGSAGADFGVSIRSLNGGSSSGKILVLVDGIPVNNGWNGGLNFNALPVEFIDKVEVVKGPSSALHGSQATAGVVNIMTKEPTEEGFAGWFSGSQETDASKHINKPQQDGFNRPVVQSSELQFRGVYNSKDNKLLITLGRKQANNSYTNPDTSNLWRSNDFRIAYKRRFSDKLLFNASAGIHVSKYDNPYFDNFKKDILQNNIHLSAIYNHSFAVISPGIYLNYFDSKIKTINTNISTGDKSYRIGSMINLKKAVLSGAGIINTGIDIFTDQVNNICQRAIDDLTYEGQRDTLLFLKGDSVKTGVDVFRGNLVSNKKKHNTLNAAAYFQYEQKILNGLNITTGGRIDIHQQFGMVFSPKLGATWEVYSKNKYSTNIKINFGQGFRAPDLRALFSRSTDGYGYPDMKPEKTTNFDFGVLQRFSQWGYLEASLFYMQVKDLIINDKNGKTGYGNYVLVPGHSEYIKFNRRINRGAYNPSGLEISMKLIPAERVIYQAHYTYLDPEEFTFQTSQNRFYHSVNYGYDLTSTERISGSIIQNYTGKGYFFDFRDRPYNSYSLWEMRLSLRFLERYRVSVIGKNISDTTYQHWHYAWQPGRSFIFKFEVSY